MKWVLLLGLVVSLANGRTVFDYERDGLENKQEGYPGRSVTGQYEWRGPDGRVTEVSYIADHMGFRLLDELELKPPTEPFRPAESTAQASSKPSSYYSNQEEEEEDEEEEEEEEGEEEENEEGENEEEEEEEEEGGGEETSAAQKADRTSGTETEQKEVNGEGSETEGTEKEAASQANEDKGKSLDQGDATKKKVTEAKEDAALLQTPVSNEPVIEARTGTEKGSTSNTPVLVPTKVELVSPEDGPSALEPTFTDETQISDIGTAFASEVPALAVGKMALTAEPAVPSIVEDPTVTFSETQIVSEIAPTVVDFNNDPFSGMDGIQGISSIDNRQTMSVDSIDSPSAFPGPAVVVIGSFSEEGQQTGHSFNNQNDYEREERTVSISTQAQEQVPEPFIRPVELDSFNIPLSQIAESLQQPLVETEPLSMDLALLPVAEPLQQPVAEMEPVFTDKAVPLIVSRQSEIQLPSKVPVLSAFESETAESFLADVPQIPVAKSLEIEPQATMSVPIIEFQVPQIPNKVIQDIPVEELPFALPLQQIQPQQNPDVSATLTVPVVEFQVPQIPTKVIQDIPLEELHLSLPQQQIQPQITPDVSATLTVPVIEFEIPQIPTELIQDIPVQELPFALPLQQIQPQETADVSASIIRTIERPINEGPSPTVFVREIELSDFDKKPVLELELPKHRFYVSKSDHSLENVPILVDATEQDSPKEFFIISETLQVPNIEPVQPIFHKEMVIKAKTSSPRISETSSMSLHKPLPILSRRVSDAVNFIPVETPSFVDVELKPLEGDVIFVPEETVTTDSMVMPVEAPISVPRFQEQLPRQVTEQLVPTLVGKSGHIPTQPENNVVSIVKIPVDIDTPEDAVLVRVPESLVVEEAKLRQHSPMQGPPLLPPLMKVPRLLM